jgi:phage-related minor tail protein
LANAKIKGITVEIGGDTTKLGKALQNSEQNTRTLQSELRQVEKLLKFDPTNT